MNDTFLYYSFHVLGFICAFLYVFLSAERFELKKARALVLLTAAYVSMYGWTLILKLLITGTGGQNAIRSYIFLPVFVSLFAAALSMDRKKSLDLLAVVPPIVQGISHIGCIFPGCCYSWWQVSWGIYNKTLHTRLFPVQLCESATALLVALWLLIRRKGKESDGLDTPRMMIVFGGTRFLWEFLRGNEKLFWGISELALWALGMTVLGIVWMIIGNKKAKG